MGKKNTKPPKHLTSKPTWDHNHYVPLFDEMIDSGHYSQIIPIKTVEKATKEDLAL